jgi:hypothetical protein
MRDDQPPLASFEPEVPDRLVSRRDASGHGASDSGGAAAALAAGSVPVLLAALARDSFAQAPTTIRGVLEFAYILESLEYEFYNAVLSAPAFAVVRGTLTQVETATLTQIRRHELAHVNLLRTTIGQLGGMPATLTAANFDFTAGNGSGAGPLAAASSDKAVLLATAQSLEDTGVRAYKGQVAKLMGNKDVLTMALQIHSVEARHAAKIRRMRGVKAWVTNDDPSFSPPAGAEAMIGAIYGGEQNTTHAEINFAGAAESFGGTAAVTEAFDEPMAYEQVLTVFNPFIAGGP